MPPRPELAGKRELNKAKNRADILAAARSVFVDIGYEAATVRDIVARTELAPGTFYNYFPDKRSILLALMEDLAAIGKARVRRARAQATSVEDFVTRSFRAYFDFVAEEPTLFELTRRNLATLRTLSVEQSGFAEGIAELRADLERGMAAGRLPKVSLAYLPAAVGAIAFEVGAQMVTRDPPDVEGATRFAADLFLGGVERMVRNAAMMDDVRKGGRKRPRGARR